MSEGDAEREFQRVVGSLDYPLYIVTMARGDQRSGCLVGFATQCSIHPPRYWVCISKKNKSYQVAVSTEAMVVHAPGPDDVDLVRLFGEETGDEVDKFEMCDWRPAPDGRTPLLDGCDRWFAGPVVDRVDGGDHASFLVAVTDAARGSTEGQFGFQQGKDLDPGHEA
jgi:flavin reductase (DIM6/NTAB) family NADH-FMN oxidoreductase RutF